MAIKRELRKRENPGAPRRDSKEPSNTMVDTRRSASANKWPLSSPQNSSSSGSKPLQGPRIRGFPFGFVGVIWGFPCFAQAAEGNLPEKADVGVRPGSESRDFGLTSSDRRGSDAEEAADACEAEKSRQPPGAVNCVSWNMLASASEDHTIRIWGVNELNPRRKGARPNGVHYCDGNGTS